MAKKLAFLFLLLVPSALWCTEPDRRRCNDKPRGLPVVVTEVKIVAPNLRARVTKHLRENIEHRLAEKWATFARCQEDLMFLDWFPRHLEARPPAATLSALIDNSGEGEEVSIKVLVTAAQGATLPQNEQWDVRVLSANDNLAPGDEGARWIDRFYSALKQLIELNSQSTFKGEMTNFLAGKVPLNKGHSFLFSGEHERRIALPILDEDLCAAEQTRMKIEFEPNPPQYDGEIVAIAPSPSVRKKDPPEWKNQAQLRVDILRKPSGEIKEWS